MLPKFDVLTDEQIDKIHKNSLKILQEIGVEFSYDPAIEVFKKHGQRG
jgi:trimethylamine:corrinoid methyltransferase